MPVPPAVPEATALPPRLEGPQRPGGPAEQGGPGVAVFALQLFGTEEFQEKTTGPCAIMANNRVYVEVSLYCYASVVVGVSSIHRLALVSPLVFTALGISVLALALPLCSFWHCGVSISLTSWVYSFWHFSVHINFTSFLCSLIYRGFSISLTTCLYGLRPLVLALASALVFTDCGVSVSLRPSLPPSPGVGGRRGERGRGGPVLRGVAPLGPRRLLGMGGRPGRLSRRAHAPADSGGRGRARRRGRGSRSAPHAEV